MAKLGRYSADRKKIEALSASKTLAVADCGTIFTLEGNSAFTITLPTAASAGKGWWCKFIANADHNNADHVITRHGDDSNNIHVICVNTGAVITSASSPQLKITLEGAQTEIGDQLEFVTDGSSWFVTAICNSATAFAIATS